MTIEDQGKEFINIMNMNLEDTTNTDQRKRDDNEGMVQPGFSRDGITTHTKDLNFVAEVN